MKKVFSVFFFLVIVLWPSVFSFENASALSVSTSSFDLRTNVTGAYAWRNNILYGEGNGTIFPYNTGATNYQFNTTPVMITGNYATIDFYTNMVATQPTGTNWVNLNLMGAGLTCVAPDVQSSVERKSYETFVTPWSSNGSPRSTLTVHGTVVIKLNASSGSSRITCAWGNSNYQFYKQNIINAQNVKLYFESGGNTVDVNFSSNVDDALLQAQIQNQQTTINQNQQMINQNQQIINNQQQQQQQDQQDREDLEGTGTEADSAIEESQQGLRDSMSNIIGNISDFFTILNTTPASDCKINADLGNMDMGEIDFCQGKPTQFQTIFNICSSLLLVFFAFKMSMKVYQMVISLNESVVANRDAASLIEYWEHH